MHRPARRGPAHRRAAGALLALLPIWGACGTAAQLRPDLAAVPSIAIERDEFPGAAALLPALDAPDDERGWRKGDALLFGVRFRHGDDVQRWLVRLDTIDPAAPLTWSATWSDTHGTKAQMRSEMAVLAIAIHAADGSPLEPEATTTAVARAVFDAGPAVLAPHMGRWRDDQHVDADGTLRSPTADQRRAYMLDVGSAYTSISTFLQALQDDATLAPYFWRIVEKPIGAVLLAFGKIDVVANCGDLQVAQGPLPTPIAAWIDAPTYEWPVDVNVNGVTVLRARVLVTEPRPPLCAAAGILAASAVHPADPERRIDIALLAARRGAAAPAAR